MRRNGRMNDASRYRSIARRVRDGADPKSLTDDLERIKDPYYSSLALQSMSGSFRAERGMRRELLSRAVSLISDVPQEWRRAELMEVLLKRSRGLPPELESMIFKGVLRAILDMEDGSRSGDAPGTFSRRTDPSCWRGPSTTGGSRRMIPRP